MYFNYKNSLTGGHDVVGLANFGKEAQKWERTYGGAHFARSVEQTSDGGYVFAGYVNFHAGTLLDAYLAKTDPSGTLLWEKAFGGADIDMAECVQQTSDGGYVLVGETESYGAANYDVYLVKTDASGNLVWQKTFGDSGTDTGYSVKQTSDGGYIVVGNTYKYGGFTNVYLIKTDSSGNLTWQKGFGGADYEWGYSVQQTSDGGYIIGGATDSYGAGGTDAYLVKTDSSGNLVWQKTFGGGGTEYAFEVPHTSEGGYIFAGETGTGPGLYDGYLVKTDSSGNLVWQKTYGGTDEDTLNSVQQTRDGGYIAAGVTSSFGQEGLAYLVKTNPSGNLQWQKVYGDTGHDGATSVRQTSDGGYIMAGFAGNTGIIFLIKTDTQGNSK
jgi:hypothetical protein